MAVFAAGACGQGYMIAQLQFSVCARLCVHQRPRRPQPGDGIRGIDRQQWRREPERAGGRKPGELKRAIEPVASRRFASAACDKLQVSPRPVKTQLCFQI